MTLAPGAGFFPLGLEHPWRQDRLGTCDEAWAREIFPEDPRDTDPLFYNQAPADQQIPQAWSGQELFVCHNMHPEKPRVEGRVAVQRLSMAGELATAAWDQVKLVAKSSDTVVGRCLQRFKLRSCQVETVDQQQSQMLSQTVEVLHTVQSGHTVMRAREQIGAGQAGQGVGEVGQLAGQVRHLVLLEEGALLLAGAVLQAEPARARELEQAGHLLQGDALQRVAAVLLALPHQADLEGFIPGQAGAPWHGQFVIGDQVRRAGDILRRAQLQEVGQGLQRDLQGGLLRHQARLDQHVGAVRRQGQGPAHADLRLLQHPLPAVSQAQAEQHGVVVGSQGDGVTEQPQGAVNLALLQGQHPEQMDGLRAGRLLLEDLKAEPRGLVWGARPLVLEGHG